MLEGIILSDYTPDNHDMDDSINSNFVIDSNACSNNCSFTLNKSNQKIGKMECIGDQLDKLHQDFFFMGHND